MKNTKQNISVNDIVSQLKDMRETADIFVPSQGKAFPFKVLTTAQQKSLLKTLMGDSVLNNNFNSELNKIIVQNLQGEELMPDDINIHDRNSIAIQLRVASLGNVLETEDEEGKSIKIDLEKVPKEEKIFSTLVIEEDDLKITLGIPSILDDEMYGLYIKSPKRSEITENGIEAMGTYAIDAVYVKIAEHIVSIERPSKNKFFDTRQDGEATLTVVQNLPSKIFKKIYEKIQKEYIDPVNNFLEVDGISLEIKSLFSLV